jgi:hypothetical protein
MNCVPADAGEVLPQPARSSRSDSVVERIVGERVADQRSENRPLSARLTASDASRRITMMPHTRRRVKPGWCRFGTCSRERVHVRLTSLQFIRSAAASNFPLYETPQLQTYPGARSEPRAEFSIV